ncbi:hypothetical protein D3C85_1259230 [compost metagenome]
MSLRDKLKKLPAPEHPDWINEASQTTKSLYSVALEEFIRLKSLIMTGKPIALKDRKINLSTVARHANKDKSILSARRQANLMAWISDRNAELAQLIKVIPASKSKKRSPNYLRMEVARLKAQNNEALTQGLRFFVESVLNSNVLEEKDKLARDNIELNQKILKLQEQLVNLKKQCNQQATEIAKLRRHGNIPTPHLTLVIDPSSED